MFLCSVRLPGVGVYYSEPTVEVHCIVKTVTTIYLYVILFFTLFYCIQQTKLPGEGGLF